MDESQRWAGQHSSGNHRGMLDGHQLELRLDADPFWMSPMRALVTELAIRANFDLDSVSDLTLAIDEACAVLIKAATGEDTLACRFNMQADRITVMVTLCGSGLTVTRSVPTNTFGWRVMHTLADKVELLNGLNGSAGALGIRLTKLRMPDDG